MHEAELCVRYGRVWSALGGECGEYLLQDIFRPVQSAATSSHAAPAGGESQSVSLSGNLVSLQVLLSTTQETVEIEWTVPDTIIQNIIITKLTVIQL